MFNLGMGEITVIVLLALIFLGPKKLPELASGLGKLIREVRKTTADVKNEIQLDDAIRKPFEELRDAVTLHPNELKRRDNLRRDLENAQREAAAVAKQLAEAEAAAVAAAENATGEPNAGAETAGGEASGRATGVSDVVSGAVPPAEAGTTPPGVGVPAAPGAVASAVSRTSGSGPLAAAGGRSTLATLPAASPYGTIPRGPTGSSSLPSTFQRPLTSSSPAPHGPTTPSTEVGSSQGQASSLGGARQPADLSRTLLGVFDSHRETARATTASSPPSQSAADRSNTTQSLSEADLAAIAVSPPPPPAAARTGRLSPPPASGLPGATPSKLPPEKSGSVPAVLASVPGPSSKSGPVPAVPASTPGASSKSGPAAAAVPASAEPAEENKPEPTTT